MPLTHTTPPHLLNRVPRLVARRWTAVTGVIVLGTLISLTSSPFVTSLRADEASIKQDLGQVVVDVRIEGNETIPESVILQKIQ